MSNALVDLADETGNGPPGVGSGSVLDWAKAASFRSGNNPVEEISEALRQQLDRKGHHAALPYVDLRAFVENLRGDDVTIPDWLSSS